MKISQYISLFSKYQSLAGDINLEQLVVPNLSKKRLAWCSKKEPRYALTYAAHLMSPSLFNWCRNQKW